MPRGGKERERGRGLPAQLMQQRSTLIIQTFVQVCRPLKRTFPRDETRRGALLKGLWQDGGDSVEATKEHISSDGAIINNKEKREKNKKKYYKLIH